MHLPGQGIGGGMMAIGETPESVRVGDLRRRRRSSGWLFGVNLSISELRRKGMRYFDESCALAPSISLPPDEMSREAASFAAFVLIAQGLPCPFGTNGGRLPLSAWRIAAECALCAPFFSGKKAPYGNRLDISPAMK
jgi:hypothetical protein